MVFCWTKGVRSRGPIRPEDAFRAWEGMAITKEPLEATPDDDACRFCEWKACCPAWFHARSNGVLPAPTGIFRDEVALVLQFDEASGACMVELVKSQG